MMTLDGRVRLSKEKERLVRVTCKTRGMTRGDKN